MTGRRTASGRVAAIGLAVAAVVASVSSPGPSGAASVDATAWWWRAQTGQLVALPPPPNVPDGSLFVQGSADGASAVAAVRFSVPPGEVASALTMRFQDDASASSAAAADVVVLACQTTGPPWQAGGNQAWTTKPTVTPACAPGVVTEDGSAMTFAIAALGGTAVVDLLLVSGEVEGRPAGTAGSLFSIVFAAPTAADLVTAAPPVTAPPSTSPSGGIGDAAVLPPAPGPVSSGSGGGSRPAAPVARPALPTAQVAAPGALPSSATATATAPARPAAPVVEIEGVQSTSGLARALAGLVLVGAIVAAVALGGGRERMLAVLGRVPAGGIEDGSGAGGGIGRFRRERLAAPPSLL